MKKEVNIVIGNRGLSAFKTHKGSALCKNEVELFLGWFYLVSSDCPCFHLSGCSLEWDTFAHFVDSSVPEGVFDAWCYCGVWIFACLAAEGGSYYWVRLGNFIKHFDILDDAKLAVYNFLSGKEVV